MAEDNKSLFVLASIVGIVAVVGLVVMFVGNSAEVSVEDGATGYAVYKYADPNFAKYLRDPITRKYNEDGRLSLSFVEKNINCPSTCYTYYKELSVELGTRYQGISGNTYSLEDKGKFCACSASLQGRIK